MLTSINKMGKVNQNPGGKVSISKGFVAQRNKTLFDGTEKNVLF